MTENMFMTWEEGDEKGRAKAIAQAGVGAFSRSSQIDFDGSVVRHGLNRSDYNRFRGNEKRPRKSREIQQACLDAYDDFGLVRNIHDTMADFTVKGIEVIHPVAEVDDFFRKWFLKVRGPDVSCMMALTLLLTAACPVLRHTARIKRKDEKNIRRGLAGEDVEIRPPFILENKRIPWEYTLLNPSTLTVLGDDLSVFIGPKAFRYAVDVPPLLISRIKSPRDKIDREMVESLPQDLRELVRRGGTAIPIDPNRLQVLHHKKFDWQGWGVPITYTLLDDLNMLKKLKLADLTALDGCISHIRLWKVGSLEHRRLPGQKTFDYLANLLAMAGNGQNFDLIWGPDIELQETSTEIHKFLGQEKYTPHLTAIYAGYGIPPSLTGMTTETGFTNNAISLKIMTERLAYVRRIVEQFWKYEISLVQNAMGFRLPAKVRFDRLVLTDEAAEKALLVQLADRDLISVGTLQERFGEDPIIEEVRQRAENRKRKSRKLPRKSGPWHEPQLQEKLIQSFVGQGVLTPSEVGVELNERKEGELSPLEMRAKPAPDNTDQTDQTTDDEPVGDSLNGRPKNSKDKKRRKRKRVLVRKVKAQLLDCLEWAETTQKTIAEILTPVYLQTTGKKNLRQLTHAESQAFEALKFAALVNCPYRQPLNEQTLAALLDQPLSIPPAITDLLGRTIAKYQSSFPDTPLAMDKRREFERKIVALYKYDQ